MNPFDPSYRSQITETAEDRKSRAAQARARPPGAASQMGSLKARTPEQFGRDQAKLRRSI